MKKTILLLLLVVFLQLNINAQRNRINFRTLGKNLPKEIIGTWVYDDDIYHFELWIAGQATYSLVRSPCLIGCYKLIRNGKLLTDFAFDDKHIPDTLHHCDIPKGSFSAVDGYYMIYRDAVTGLGDMYGSGHDVDYYLIDSVSMEVEIHNEYEFFEHWRELTKYDWPNTPRSTWSKEMQERWEEFNVFKPKGCSFPYYMLLRKVSNDSPFKKKK